MATPEGFRPTPPSAEQPQPPRAERPEVQQWKGLAAAIEANDPAHQFSLEDLCDKPTAEVVWQEIPAEQRAQVEAFQSLLRGFALIAADKSLDTLGYHELETIPSGTGMQEWKSVLNALEEKLTAPHVQEFIAAAREHNIPLSLILCPTNTPEGEQLSTGSIADRDYAVDRENEAWGKEAWEKKPRTKRPPADKWVLPYTNDIIRKMEGDSHGDRRPTAPYEWLVCAATPIMREQFEKLPGVNRGSFGDRFQGGNSTSMEVWLRMVAKQRGVDIKNPALPVLVRDTYLDDGYYWNGTVLHPDGHTQEMTERQSSKAQFSVRPVI